MALVIGVVSQKGGVGKSTCARLIVREYAHAGWDVKIADLDVSQGTSFDWHVRRLQQQLQPSVAVERFGTVEQALKARAHYDLLVMDGAPHSTTATLKIVEPSTLAVLPTGLSLEDLKPQVLLAHELGEERNRQAETGVRAVPRGRQRLAPPIREGLHHAGGLQRAVRIAPREAGLSESGRGGQGADRDAVSHVERTCCPDGPRRHRSGNQT